MHSPSKPIVQASQGMVASSQPLASLAGTEVLLRGGNAVDAAVATAFALNVVEPSMSCVGGGGFMLIYKAATQEVTALDYREINPQAARPGMYAVIEGVKSSEGWTQVDGDAHMVGHLAAAVPGSVAGLMHALEQHGTMDRQTVMAPAIRFAEQGFPVYSHLREAIINNMHKVGKFPATRAIYTKDGEPYDEGETLYQKDLGATLREIAAHGTAGFYEGRIAEAIVSEMERNGGLITAQDLKEYVTKRPRTRKPAQGTYRGYRIVSMCPPSSGGTHMIQMLNMLEHFDLRSLGHNSAATIHLLSEVMRRAFADREKYMGDPDFVEIPFQGLISKEYAGELAAGISVDKITNTVYAGNPARFGAESVPEWPEPDLKDPKTKARIMGPQCTTHYSVVDRWGNMVASTQTINDGFGCGVVVPGTGIKLNDQMENMEPTGGKANSIAPGKSCLSSMSPSLVMTPDGTPLLTVGSPGSARIFSTVMQIVLNVIDFGMNVQEAIAAPRMFAPVDEIALEARVGQDVIGQLREMGHRVDVRGEWDTFFGGATGIQLDPVTGLLLGGCDPRRSGRAMGY